MPLIDLYSYPVSDVLEKLLSDKTTGELPDYDWRKKSSLEFREAGR